MDENLSTRRLFSRTRACMFAVLERPCPLQRHHLYTPLAVGSPPVDLGNLA